MALDFTVILFQRQHFGNEPNYLSMNAPFVGKSKDYSFDCPNVNPNETAILLFQSYDVTTGRNRFRINGVEVFGGLPVGPEGKSVGAGQRLNILMSNVLLVESRHQLRASGNVLHVEAQAAQTGSTDIDDFILDNVVIVFKTTSTPRPQPEPQPTI